MTTLSGEFQIASWNEDTYAEREGGRKLTRAAVTQDVTGDVTGKGQVEWLMAYKEDGTARFVGLQQLDVTIGDREGSVVVDSIGDFDGSEAKGVLTVVPGTGTGGLAGMSGSGEFSAPMGSKATFTLACSFD